MSDAVQARIRRGRETAEAARILREGIPGEEQYTTDDPELDPRITAVEAIAAGYTRFLRLVEQGQLPRALPLDLARSVMVELEHSAVRVTRRPRRES